MTWNRDPAATCRASLDRIARRERGRLIGKLTRRLGPQHLALAEDVAQDALLKALSIWPYEGVPDNPAAWLSQVALNKAIDILRRGNREQPWEASLDTRDSDGSPAGFGSDTDPELETIFLCCQPGLSAQDRLALTLRVVAGFTAREIGGLFLVSEQAMSQRLARAKRKLARAGMDFSGRSRPEAIAASLDTVLKVIYLMFSLGYAPGSGAVLVRRDVALEALRLSRALLDLEVANAPASNALHALLCLQASRLDAREDGEGNPVLFRDQDRQRWDRELIRTGSHYLRLAADGDRVSRYHLEAAIAGLYASSTDWQSVDWQGILRCHETLARLTDSPVAAMNRCIALAFAGEPEAALGDLLSLDAAALSHYTPFYIAQAEILRLLHREEQARLCYEAALRRASSVPVARFMEKQLALLS